RFEDLEPYHDTNTDPDLHALLLQRLERSKIKQRKNQKTERPLLPQRRNTTINQQQKQRIYQQINIQPIRLKTIQHWRKNNKTGFEPAPSRMAYVIVPRSSIKLP